MAKSGGVVKRAGPQSYPIMCSFYRTGTSSWYDVAGQARKNPENTIFQVKRIMGRDFDDEHVQKQKKSWPFKLEKNNKGKPEVVVTFQGEKTKFCAEEISAMILSKMKEVAEDRLGKGMVKKAVVTVPAYFNDRQRQATKDAGKIAGIEILRILNEPTAAAFAYGLDNSGIDEKVLVFDLGGGTFDVSILHIQNKQFKVLATGGDTNLGGEDFDDAVVKHCIKEFKKQHCNSNIQHNNRAIRRLRNACEKAKCDLSFQSETTIDIEMLCDGVDFVLQLSRAKLENLLANFFNKCMTIMQDVMQSAGLISQDIDKVLLVGGSSRIPKLHKMLCKVFDASKICKSIHPDEAVAQGAAIQAAILSGNGGQPIQDIVIQDVTPLSLGVSVVGGLMCTIVPRNTAVPCKKQEILRTAFDYQTAISMGVYQGERPLVTNNQFLGEFVLTGVRSDLKGRTKLTLQYEIDDDGILAVSATEIGNKKNKSNICLNREQLALEKSDIDRMILTTLQFERQDERERQRIVEKVKFMSSLDDLQTEVRFCQIIDGDQLQFLQTHQQWFAQNEYATCEQFANKTKEIQQYLLNLSGNNS